MPEGPKERGNGEDYDLRTPIMSHPYVLGVALPLGMWWGLMRDLGGGSLWPSLVSHFVTEFGTALASASPPN